MPCDRVYKISVEFKQCTDLDALVAALCEIGFNVRKEGNKVVGREVEFKDGKLRCEEGMVQSIKQAYSRQIVKKSAKRNNWWLKQTAPNKYAVIKRW